MMQKSTWLMLVVGLVFTSASAIAATPPAADELTENAAAQWGAEAQYATASVTNDTSLVHEGSASIRFDTDGGFDCWMWAPATQDGDWDLFSTGTGGFSFWVYTENPNVAFQNNSPWIRLCTDPNNYYEFSPSHDILNEARGTWVYVSVPLTGDDTWTRSETGSPDFGEINYIEIHGDTWDAGFTVWLDDLSFDVPVPAPGGVRAFPGNGEIELSWDVYDDLYGTFDHYAIYRDTATFSSVASMTPIATVSSINTTSYVDTTAANGTSYYYAISAVFSGGMESTDVEAVGPRTPRDETDLQVACIARTPRYPRYDPAYSYYTITEPSGFGPYNVEMATGLNNGQTASTQRAPEIGDPVTFTASVRNSGTNAWVGTLSGTWMVDDSPVATPSQAVSLQPGDVATFDYVMTWDDVSHAISWEIDVTDDRADNNAMEIDSKSVAFLSYIDRTHMEDFRAESASYPNAYSDDLIDWLNHHMEVFNQMFIDHGCAKRVHFDILEVLEDDDPDPSVNTIEFAIFPFRYHAGNGTLRLSGYFDSNDDVDYGLLHEMGHQLGLIDIYRLDLPQAANEVSGIAYSGVAGLMHGVSHFLSEHSALAMTHWLDTAHGYYGQYQYETPNEVQMRFLGSDGYPLNGATVYVYQKASRPGLGEVITNQIKFQGTTDATGVYTLPNVEIDPNLAPPTYTGDQLRANPFGYISVVATNGLLLFKVEHRGYVDYAWLDITEVNNAYWNGDTDVAQFERQLSLGGTLQCYPPPDMAEDNAEHWTSWAQDGQISLSDDEGFALVGNTSLRVDATGGLDNYVRYPGDQLAKWDLTGVDNLHFWVYAINENFSFQNGSPWIRLGNDDGYFQWNPSSELLNSAVDRWVELSVPLTGSSLWTRSTSGTPTLEEIHYIEIHADTWGAGFTLWFDDLRFDPPLEAILGDVNYDNRVNLSDLQILLANYGTLSGAQWTDGDMNEDGAVDLSDLQMLLSAYGTECE